MRGSELGSHPPPCPSALKEFLRVDHGVFLTPLREVP